ncbi:hypothetical protein GCM10009677_09370 [Sphaerisporangium rubeum]|uniref:Metallo-beta-lactamase domain-containing protein n=1 Tax=Sphaerisporangium rubeum TaxID=321317 RepID=A0A7X0MAZ7_9ACTN|nr:hypothetical protein [Sphaerisporangium rubeum]MBB6476556.1 hypothetical protein [Sphaerisporangium rubeum]
MADSARLEIHIINVSQGDSVLIINRDLDKVAAAITKVGWKVPDKPIDYVPFAVAKNVSLLGTVKKALLIDGGDSSYGEDVVNMLKRHGVVDGPGFYKDLYMMVSHFHADHQAGLHTVLMDKEVSKVKGKKTQIVPRFIPGKMFVNPLYDKASVPKNQIFPAFRRILEEISSLSRKSKRTEIVEVQPGGTEAHPTLITPLEIGLGDGVSDKDGKAIPITIKMVASGQQVYVPATVKSGVTAAYLKDVPQKASAVDMNDRSLCFVLTYGSFRYFGGGDIAGDGRALGGNEGTKAMPDPPKGKKNKKKKKNKKLGSSNSHGDVETVLGPSLEWGFPATKLGDYVAGVDKYPYSGGCTVMKASHHASASSVDTYFLATVRPFVVAISCGFKARPHDHPTQQVLDRLDKTLSAQWGVRGSKKKVDNSVKGLYLTEVIQKRKGRTYDTDVHDGLLLGDIVIRPVDESIVDARASSTVVPGPEVIKVQVYGTGDKTDTVDTDNRLFDGVTVSKTGHYPIGPYFHPSS